MRPVFAGAVKKRVANELTFFARLYIICEEIQAAEMAPRPRGHFVVLPIRNPLNAPVAQW